MTLAEIVEPESTSVMRGDGDCSEIVGKGSGSSCTATPGEHVAQFDSKGDILGAWSALNAVVYANAERASLHGLDSGQEPAPGNVGLSGCAASMADSSISTRGKRIVALTSKLCATGGGTIDRPQRKRHADGSKVTATTQPIYVSCLPGAPFERPLLLSPVSDLPDRLAAISYCPAVSDWNEMVGDYALRSEHGSFCEVAIKETTRANASANDPKKQGSIATSHIFSWEERRILKYRIQADLAQLKAVLKAITDAHMDGHRQLNDTAVTEKTQVAALQAVSNEFAVVAQSGYTLQGRLKLNMFDEDSVLCKQKTTKKPTPKRHKSGHRDKPTSAKMRR